MLTKAESQKELMHPIKGNKMTIEEVAQKIVEDYSFGIFI